MAQPPTTWCEWLSDDPDAPCTAYEVIERVATRYRRRIRGVVQYDEVVQGCLLALSTKQSMHGVDFPPPPADAGVIRAYLGVAFDRLMPRVLSRMLTDELKHQRGPMARSGVNAASVEVASSSSAMLRRIDGADEILHSQPNHRVGGEQSVITLEFCTLVRSQVDRLPKAFRDVVTLRYFDELDTKQTAAHLLIPEGTVKRRLHDALLYLRNEVRWSQAVLDHYGPVTQSEPAVTGGDTK